MNPKLLILEFVKLFRAADALVAADAVRQGISKDEAWAGVDAAVRIQAGHAIELLLDFADPLGWRAAARATD
jgi:hypothetical protein